MSSDLWWAIWGPTIFYCIICLVIAIVFGIITRNVIYNKGYHENWFWWGFFFGWIALVIALTKPDIRYQQYGTPVSPEDRYSKEKDDAYTLNHGGWRCYNCRSVNPSFVGTCKCGMSRGESVAKEAEAQQFALERAKLIEGSQSTKSEQSKPKTVAESSEEAIKLAEAISKFKELLDMGVITQEEFEEKKNSLLNTAKDVEEVPENTEAEEPANPNWNCTNCGHENEGSTKCCSYCGSIKMIQYSQTSASNVPKKVKQDTFQTATQESVVQTEPQESTVQTDIQDNSTQPDIQNYTGQLSYCPICNGEIYVGDKFCTNCGTELTWTMG